MAYNNSVSIILKERGMVVCRWQRRGWGSRSGRRGSGGTGPGGPQLQGRRLLGDEAGQTGHLAGPGDSVGEIVQDVDALLLGGGRQRLQRVPGFGPRRRAWPEADIALAHPAARAEFGAVVMQR